MRILYVTGHYPPDLTSGATLQVQRLAHAALRAGHDVQVLAGGYRAGLADGETRDTIDGSEADGTGVPVRWIGSTGWTDQDHEANWRNPRADTVVGELLDSWQPDVVHAHALQTLGGGVVTEASRRGIRTVVTMHDLWWWCARLFLVDTSMRPCSLVTCLGECPCAHTAQWRDERALALREALAQVDVVLAPSSALRDVVVANGLDPYRVRVDPNDVAIGERPTPVDPPDVLGAADVRFLYLGGPNPLKGADVVASAARHLTGANGWRLLAYGLEEPSSPLPERATVLDAFDPEQRDSVLGSADVLLLPSVARESYSLAAREALAAGLAVITSDCLGPEEVVEHDLNGIVVPTGDPVALAEAMGSLVDDRSLLLRLRHGAAATPLPDLDADRHLTELLDAYRSPTDRPTVDGDRTPPSVLFVVGADDDVTRWRGHQTAEALTLLGSTAEVRHLSDPSLPSAAAGHDVTILVRTPLCDEVAGAVAAARAAGRVVLFDADDLTDLQGSLIPFCDGVLTATTLGAEAIGTTFDTAARSVPLSVGIVEGVMADRRRSVENPVGSTRRTVRVGVLVADDADSRAWGEIEATVVATLTARPAAELHLIGPARTTDIVTALGPRLHRADMPSWRDRASVLDGLDIVLAPVDQGATGAGPLDVRSCRAWAAAALSATPTITADTEAIRGVAQPDKDVLLAASPEQWRAAIERLLDDDLLRRRLGAQAQRAVHLRHGPYAHGRRSLAAIDDLVRAARPDMPLPPNSGGTDPVAPVTELEPYEAPARPVERHGILTRLRRRLR